MPRPPRFFISPDKAGGPKIVISGEDFRHIVTVLRMKTGDTLLLCDGEGTEYAARITQVARDEVLTEVTAASRREALIPHITLGQGIPKSDKMDWIVQKAVELGVARIVPLMTERTIVKINDEEKRRSRWQKIAREAAMQSNRPYIPRIEPVQAFRTCIDSPAPEPGTLLLFPWEEGTTPVKDVLRSHRAVARIIVLIGPEGGCSRQEAEAARDKGFHLVSLGPNILRTETAAVAVLSMIGYEYFAPQA